MSTTPAGTPSAAAPPAPVVVPALVDALRADLTAAAYTVEHVDDLLGPVAAAALARSEALPALRATDPGTGAQDPAAVLTRAFVLGAPVPAAALDAALPTLGAQGAQRLGLVDVTGASARPLVDLRPYAATDGAGDAAWWVASDLGELATGGALRTDHVLGVGGASLTLAQATVRDPRARVLDLGTGCGVQALHAARHAEHVVATDVSPRALAFAHLTTALAGLGADRVELRTGSMLEPVAGETFDLVVSNPPFVITPRGADVPAYDYRDGGRAGDDLVRDLVTGVGAVLAPGGVAQLLANWEVRDGEQWHERIGAWVDASGLDAWVVLRDQQDPAQYAETWIRDGGTTPADRATWHARYGAWLDDLASRDVASVGFGIVTLRRPVAGAPTLRRLEQQTGPVRPPLGPVIADGLAAHDAVTRLTAEDLAGLRLTVAPDVTEERYLEPGALDPRVVLLRQGRGFGRTVQAGTALAAFVGACDGELTAGQIVHALGALLEVPAADVAADVLPTVRGLLTDGLLTLP